MKRKLPALVLMSCIMSCVHLYGQDQQKWYIPDYLTVQFAGNIGFISGGAGYVHGHNKLESDIFLGFLPEEIGGDDIVSLTGKTTYYPWKSEWDDRWVLAPFSVGMYLSYSFGSQFDTILPNEYPNGYYWWASSLRLGGFIGGKIKMELKKSSQHLSLYYELGTYDLEFISYLQNTQYLSLDDVTSLALGIKFGF